MPGRSLTRPPLPRRLQVEVTGACNLRCRMCLVRYREPLGRAASFPLREFTRLLDAIPDLDEVVLQGVGEPLMAPEIFEMIAAAKARGITVGFNSNGTLLTRRVGARLIEMGLDWLCLSLDGASPDTYEFVRDQARFAVVERNVSDFVALKQEYGVSHPELSLVMVLMRQNLHELPAIVRRAAGWGIRRVFTQNLSHDFSDAPSAAYEAIAKFVREQALLTMPRSEVQAIFAQALETARREGIELRLPHFEERTTPVTVDGTPVGCDWPFTGAYITYDGTVMPCCMVMGSDRVALGKLSEASFADIWENERYQRFRAGLLSGDPHPVCRGCSLYHGRF